MRIKILSVISCLVAFGLAGCSKPENRRSRLIHGVQLKRSTVPELSSDFALSDTTTPAGMIYTKNCASCHEQGIGRAPQRAMLLLMSPDSIHRALTRGVMQAQSAGLSDDDKIAVG